MNIEDIKRAKSDVEDIRKFVATYDEFLKTHSDCDKHARGFQVDDRFTACKKHNVWYSSYRGYYGNSSSSSWLSILNSDVFWQCFDQYLNLHQDEILLGVAELIETVIKKNVNVIKEQRDSLNSLIEELEK